MDKLKLDNQLCFALYAASKEVVRLYKPILDNYGLTYTQYIVMMVLWEVKTTSVKDLGEKVRLDSGTLSPLLNKLAEMGHITKVRDINDSRVVIIKLTEKGENLKQEMTTVPDEILCKIPMDLKELYNLKLSLDALVKTIES